METKEGPCFAKVPQVVACQIKTHVPHNQYRFLPVSLQSLSCTLLQKEAGSSHIEHSFFTRQRKAPSEIAFTPLPA